MFLSQITEEISHEISNFRARYAEKYEDMDVNAVLISGTPGMGKTHAALSYCAENEGSLYFSFQHLSAELALKAFAQHYPDIFSRCTSWTTFFQCLKEYGKEKSPTVFFDDVGVRNDKEAFYAALSDFLEKDRPCNALVVLIGRPWDEISIPCCEVVLEPFSVLEIGATLSASDGKAAKIFSLTAGIPELLSTYNPELPFEENVEAMLHTHSRFYGLLKDWLYGCFRTPETYNTLLYAMVNGYNRISELSAFSGYPKNKCDKYIKTLCQYGLVRKEPAKSGHTRYYPANSYIALWCKVLMTAVPNADGSFGEEVYEQFMHYFSSEILPAYFKGLCNLWLRNNAQDFSYNHIDFDNVNYYDVKVGDITFGFAWEKERAIYAYFNTVQGDLLTEKLWDSIEASTTKDRPFYMNEYIICTVNRVPYSYWHMSGIYDNLHIVPLEALYAAPKKREKK